MSPDTILSITLFLSTQHQSIPSFLSFLSHIFYSLLCYAHPIYRRLSLHINTQTHQYSTPLASASSTLSL